MTLYFRSFPDRGIMTDRLADAVAERLRQANAHRGCASLVVSGGETPRKLFDKLSRRRLEWDKVTVTLADERWTDPDSEHSNEYLVRSTLLVNEAAGARFVGLKTDHTDPKEAENTCETALQTIDLPFDAVLLGMGNDGHTASLFPQAETLPVALDEDGSRRTVAVTPTPLPENAPFARMTMTLPYLLSCRWLVLLIAGDSKLSAYNAALAGDDVEKMPVRGVLKQSAVPVCSYWAP